MRRVRLRQSYAVRGGARYNIGECIALDDAEALRLITLGVASPEAPPPASVTTADLSAPPMHRMTAAADHRKEGRRVK